MLPFTATTDILQECMHLKLELTMLKYAHKRTGKAVIKTTRPHLGNMFDFVHGRTVQISVQLVIIITMRSPSYIKAMKMSMYVRREERA